MSHPTSCRPLCLAILCLALIAVAGCSTSHQTIEFETAVKEDVNVVPGIEPEESARKIMVSVKGKGIEPAFGTPMQRRLMAERAAVVDGYRKLAERLAGIILNARSQGGENVISQDQIMVETNSYLRGAQVNSVTHDSGFAVAEVRVYLEPRYTKFYQAPRMFRGLF